MLTGNLLPPTNTNIRWKITAAKTRAGGYVYVAVGVALNMLTCSTAASTVCPGRERSWTCVSQTRITTPPLSSGGSMGGRTRSGFSSFQTLLPLFTNVGGINDR